MSRAPDEADRAWWRAALESQSPLEEADLAALAPEVRVRELGAGEAYLRAGDAASHVALIRAGVLRESFPLPDGRERIRAFGLAGDFAGSLSDLLRGGPARCEVIACAPARLLTIPWRAVREAAAERRGWQALLAAVTQRLYLAKAEREYELLALDAAARYQRFLVRFPELERDVAQRHIASYLGITPEHLSRLRRALGAPPPRSQRRSPRRSRPSGRR